METAGQVNIYRCETCGWEAITKNLAGGVTPFLIRCEGPCQNSGDLPGARSRFYRVNQTLQPTHEWYRPEPADVPDYAKDHVSQGGLLLRKIQAPSTGNIDAPCAACPVEVRGLYAVAFNLLNLISDPERFVRKFPERIGELKASVDAMTPLVNAHFDNREHVHRTQGNVPPGESMNAAAHADAAKLLALLVVKGAH